MARIDQGLIGFCVDEKFKLTYNRYRSDPANLGVNVLRDLQKIRDWDVVRSRVENLVGVPEDSLLSDYSAPIRKEIRRGFGDEFQVDSPRYCYELFKPFQGRLKHYLSGELGFMATANDFLYDSKHCNWAYVADLDRKVFEIHGGQQREPTLDDEADAFGYFPCRPVYNVPLTDLPDEIAFFKDVMVVSGRERPKELSWIKWLAKYRCSED